MHDSDADSHALGTQHDLVLMYTCDVPAPVLEMLQQSGYWQLQEVEYLHGSSMLGNMKTWHGIFTKLRVFSLTRYQRQYITTYYYYYY